MKSTQHEKKRKLKKIPLDEYTEWLNLTPAQRIEETTKLWKFYIAMGGGLDPEPDPQSPFYDMYYKEQSHISHAKKRLPSGKRISRIGCH